MPLLSKACAQLVIAVLAVTGAVCPCTGLAGTADAGVHEHHAGETHGSQSAQHGTVECESECASEYQAVAADRLIVADLRGLSEDDPTQSASGPPLQHGWPPPAVPPLRAMLPRLKDSTADTPVRRHELILA